MRPRHRSSHFAARFAAAFLAGLTLELVNLGLGQLTAVPTLEPLPVMAFLAGVVWGGAGVAGCMIGEIVFRCGFHPMGLFPDPTLAAEQSFYQGVGIPISYALIGVSGYLVFRLGTDLGRGFPNPRSYVAFVASSLAGGLLTAGAIHLQLLSSWKAFVVHTASNFVSILLVCPPILLLADRYLRPLMVEIPGERLPSVPFPTYLATRTEDSPGVREQRKLDGRLAVLCAIIVLLTGVVVALAQRFPQVGGWPLLGYLGPVVWTAMAYGMRGALLATSLSGVLYLLGRSVVDRDLLPDDPDLYAVGLYADFVVFSFVGAFLGSEREEEEGLRSELAERAQQMTVLNEMGDLLQACANETEAYEVITQGTRRLFPTESGVLAVLRESSHLLEVAVAWGEWTNEGRTFGAEDCWALRRGQAHFVEDPQQALLCHHLRQETATSYLCLPLMAQGEALGILHVAQRRHAGRGEGGSEVLGAARRELAVTTAKQVALALGNLKLREGLRDQSIRDPLTGLFNRRYMTESLQRERFRARRQALTFGIIMIDIDHFKRFNDKFGHEAGDMVLRELADFLQTRARREDIVCRYGGEEFVVVLSEATLEVTCKRAEDLRVEVKQLRLRHQGNLLGPVSLSLGVAAFPLHGDSEDVILRAADAALYRAKAAGRDRVIVAEILAEASGTEERQLNG